MSERVGSERRPFIGGSDARIIMGSDEAALVRLWREKRGEAEPEDLSANLIVQLGRATEELNRSWYERTTGRQVRDVQRRVRHSGIPWMAATLDGIVGGHGSGVRSQVHAALVIFRRGRCRKVHGASAAQHVGDPSEELGALHHYRRRQMGRGRHSDGPALSHRSRVGGKKFWRCVQSGEVPHLIMAEPPRPRIEAIRIVDMSSSNSWAEFAALFSNTREAFLDHERELKTLMPED